ncbi:cation transporter [Nakamurella antarctica]|uniref:Cation transporter n=1 Tax=Nakamurella antarctica TaxID=1902245 RepID=A0A3G8ZQP0_9ACTN|nr:cation transporter [Nakamurella antarctica]
MGGHSHAPPVGQGSGPNTGSRYTSRLAIAFALTAGFFVIELVAGLLSDSLALIADAGHMATDVVALGAALVATRIAGRPDSTGKRTYGRYRSEVFAAGLTCLLMLGVGVFVVIEAVGRIGAAPVVGTRLMMIVGVIGLVVNLVSLLLLRRGSQDSITMRGAYIEVLGDAAGSVGVLAAGILISATGNPIWDVIVAVGIGAFVVVRAVSLSRSVLRVLGQHIPEGVDLQEISADLGQVPGVAELHDLHIWALTSGMNVATAHLVLAPGADAHRVLDAAQQMLTTKHEIEHATLQVEPADHSMCKDLTW